MLTADDFKSMFPLSCARAQLRIAGTVSADRKSALNRKEKKSNLN